MIGWLTADASGMILYHCEGHLYKPQPSCYWCYTNTLSRSAHCQDAISKFKQFLKEITETLLDK